MQAHAPALSLLIHLPAIPAWSPPTATRSLIHPYLLQYYSTDKHIVPNPISGANIWFTHSMKCPQLPAPRPPAQAQAQLLASKPPHVPVAGIMDIWSLQPTVWLQLLALGCAPSPLKQSFTQDRVRREFNRKTGQTAMIRHRAWPDKSTNQQPTHTWPELFIPLFLYFPTLTSPHITRTSCFPCLWFLPYTSHITNKWLKTLTVLFKLNLMNWSYLLTPTKKTDENESQE